MKEVLKLEKLFILLLEKFLRFAGGVYGRTSVIFAVVIMSELNE